MAARTSTHSVLCKRLQALDDVVSVLLNRLTAYYAELVSQPFRSGLVYFLAGLIPALFIGWILFPMALYSNQQQPVNFSHAIHTDPDIAEGIEGDSRVSGSSRGLRSCPNADTNDEDGHAVSPFPGRDALTDLIALIW